MTPGWILDVFAAVMLAVAAVSAARLAAARPWQRGAVVTDTDIAHLLMAIAMAGMLAPGLAAIPDHGWQVVFALMTAWFAYRVILQARTDGVRALAGGHCAPHLVHSAAMLYMFLAVTAPAAGGGPGMSGMAGSSGPGGQTLSYPALVLALGLVLAGYSVWDLDQLSGTGRARAIAPVTLARRAVADGLTLAMARHANLASAAAAGAAAASQGTAAGTAAATEAVRIGDAARAGHVAFLLSPNVTVSCRIAMGVTMTLMLFLMI